MRNECNIVKDMLPLYIECMASADTVSFVEDHLKVCAACRTELDLLKTPNDLEKVASDIPDNGTLPLKTFQRKWQQKKAFLVCSTIFATIAIMCCILFTVDHFLYQEKIAVNGAVYTQRDDVVFELPTGSVKLGYLHGISHRTMSEPIGNFMATNLDLKYGGCTIYQSSENDRIIYLEDFRGFYIPFELTEPIPQAETR